MALLIWAVWVVTNSEVRGKKLEVRNAFNFITQTNGNSLNIQKKSPDKTGDFFF
jgi:hypothetical protein